MSNQPFVVGVATPQGMSAPYSYFAPAVALGFDQREGLDLSFFYGGEPGSTARALCSDRCNIACLNTIVGFMGRANEQLPMVAIGSKARRAHRYFAVLPNSPIRGLPDLKGKVLACDFPHLRPLAEAALEDEGVSAQDIKWVDWEGSGMEISGMVAPFQDGEVDALFIMDWTEGDATARGIPLRYLRSALFERIRVSSCYWTTERRLRTEADTLGRALRMLNKTIAFSLEKPELAVQMMWDVYPETRPPMASRSDTLKSNLAVLKACLKPMDIRTGDPDPRWCAIPEQEMAEWNRFLTSSGAIKRAIDLHGLYTMDLVDQANEFSSADLRGPTSLTQTSQ